MGKRIADAVCWLAETLAIPFWLVQDLTWRLRRRYTGQTHPEEDEQV